MEKKKIENNSPVELEEELLDAVSGGIAEAGNLGDTSSRQISSTSCAGGIVGYSNGTEISNCNSHLSDETIEDETMLIIPIV